MKAKLFKEDQIYYLSIDNKLIGSTYFKLPKGITYKLSIENCQAIERGYDLERTADIFGSNAKGNVDYKLGANYGFEKGFQYALELLGDKKFSEEDISKAIDFGVHVEAGNIDIDYKKYGTHQNQFIQSIQQNEWDVVAVTKNSRTGKIIKSESDLTWDEDGLCDRAVPKLDSSGQLILKKI
jgi:hypothetical protein